MVICAIYAHGFSFYFTVELDSTAGTEDTVLTAVSASVGSPMSPDTNHNNHQHPDNNPKESSHHHNNNGGGGGKHLLNGHHKEAAIPEQVVANGAANGLSLQGLLSMQVVKSSGGVASDVPKDLVSAKAAVGEQQEEEQKIQEYLQRSDTAVIFPEPVDHSVHGECFIKHSITLLIIFYCHWLRYIVNL